MKKVIYSLAFLSVGLSAVIISCHNGPATTDKYADEINLANFDTTVKPGDNFFEYVNGGWLKANPVPASEVRWGSFDIANDTNITRVHKLLDATAAQKNKA